MPRSDRWYGRGPHLAMDLRRYGGLGAKDKMRWRRDAHWRIWWLWGRGRPDLAERMSAAPLPPPLPARPCHCQSHPVPHLTASAPLHRILPCDYGHPAEGDDDVQEVVVWTRVPMPAPRHDPNLNGVAAATAIQARESTIWGCLADPSGKGGGEMIANVGGVGSWQHYGTNLAPFEACYSNGCWLCCWWWPCFAHGDLIVVADNTIFGQTVPKVGSFDARYGSSIMS